MKKTAGIIFRSAILILLGVTIGLLISDYGFTGHGANFSSGNDKVSKVLNLVRSNYVDSVDVDSIEGVTVNGLLQNLDPHSIYLPPQQALAINERLEGSFNGLGIEYTSLRDTMVITRVYPDGPVAKKGITVGDRIIEIDHEKMTGNHLNSEAISKKLRGAKDSEVLLAVLPAGSKTIKLYNVKRGNVELSSLDAAYMINDQTGYIKISKFASTTDTDFRKALTDLKADGLKKLVLDLRGNGGGYLNTATSLADEFLTKKQLIVFTKGLHEPRTDYFATDSGNFQQGKLAVLIDEYSASASEILAGALQDLDRAVIVGRRSFGKGLVQEQFGFDDGSAVNLTVARYYTPSGRSIQKTYKNGVEHYRNELAERMRKGELFSAENNLKDSAFINQNNYHTRTGRRVFSGGGIMPDIFVAADSNQNTWLIHHLIKQQLFTAYVVDKLQPVLSNYADSDSFVKQYTVSDTEVNQLVQYATPKLGEINVNELAASRQNVKVQLKAAAARYKWGDNAYFQALNEDDQALKKAVEAID